jgi:hypothetical protein
MVVAARLALGYDGDVAWLVCFCTLHNIIPATHFISKQHFEHIQNISYI